MISFAGLLGWIIAACVIGFIFGFCLCVASISNLLKKKGYSNIDEVPPKNNVL